MNLVFESVLIACLVALGSCTVIVKPPANKNGQDVGLIIVQGAMIDGKNYNQFSKTLQEKFQGRLWVAITEFLLSTPEPLLIKSEINNAFDKLRKEGLTINKETPFFFAGHSLGGVMLQDYILENKTYQALPSKFSGLILEGSYITRKHYDIFKQPLVAPILTLGGELDGLNRITRMAESHYYNKQDEKNYPAQKLITLIINGMNHYQFAGEGEPPFLVRKNDIQPEISTADAHSQAASIIAAFMDVAMDVPTKADTTLLGEYLKSTVEIFDPIIEALELEAFFIPPCYDVNKGENCSVSCPWTSVSQQIMASSNVTLVSKDDFEHVWVLPPHLPTIYNKCSEPFACTINSTTVSETIYTITDSFDVALQPTSATEIKTKLKSRQSLLIAASGGKDYKLEDTDYQNNCGQINQEAINWASKKVLKRTLDRYLEKGNQLRIGPDAGPYNVGPLWIWTYLKLDEKTDPVTKKRYTEVRSPAMRTPVDYFVKSAAGFHYCKVLSPARAMEWMLVDSLKP